jgi:hypothetical protein
MWQLKMISKSSSWSNMAVVNHQIHLATAEALIFTIADVATSNTAGVLD